MAKIGDCVICLLLTLNFIGIISTFILMTNNNSSVRLLNEKFEINVRRNNLRGRKINKIQRELDINNYNHILYKEGKFKKEYISNKKNIRRLSFNNDIILYLLVLNILSLYFCIILMISFCIQSKSDYSSNNSNSNRSKSKGSSSNSDCDNCGNCGGGGGDSGGVAIVFVVFLVVVLIVVLTYGLTKGIGKHASRYVSLVMLIFTHFFICIVCIISLIIGKGLVFYIIGGISTTLLVCNILGILLPNLNCCQI